MAIQPKWDEPMLSRAALLFAACVLLPAATRASDYSVKAGDTLSRIAKRELGDAGRWKVIADRNNIKPPYTIRSGQRLILPPISGIEASCTPGRSAGLATAQSGDGGKGGTGLLETLGIGALSWKGIALFCLLIWPFYAASLKITCWMFRNPAAFKTCLKLSFVLLFLVVAWLSALYTLSLFFSDPGTAINAAVLSTVLYLLVAGLAAKRFVHCGWIRGMAFVTISGFVGQALIFIPALAATLV